MADEHDRWLDRETAELLLRGEPLEALDPAARERAERLAGTLGALSASSGPATLPDGELPGEEAALTAFRQVRAERDDAGAAGAGAPGGGGSRFGDAGLVTMGARRERVRTPLRCRSLRLALAAVLAVGMIGGVAFAAGNGVLPTPFGGPEPEPAATVSAAASPDRPLASPSPLEGTRSRSAPADGGTPGTAPDTAPGTRRDEEESGEQGGAPEAGDPGRGGAEGRRSGLVASCRKVRAGKDPDGSHRRALKQAAGESSRIAAYCRSLLGGGGGGTGKRNSDRNSDIGGGDHHKGPDREKGRGQGQGQGLGEGRGGRDGHDAHDAHDSHDSHGGRDGKAGDTGHGDDDDAHPASASAPSLAPHPRRVPTYAPQAPALSGVRRLPSPGV